ncbi:MAG TPA: winged helix-turn-helix transcriptional regulator [Magnetospirillaceae bacterium]|nr:winged helix-turn-helix transcriptional regulator [Magnetospirillaceae bacterium]
MVRPFIPSSCPLFLFEKSMQTDTELAVLENILGSAGSAGAAGAAGVAGPARATTQRSLARGAGLSLGMTNVLLKRLTEKGWVTVRRVNSRNLQYALTPEGVQEIARRTYRYLKRTARSTALYRDLLEEYVLAAKREGIHTLVLAGQSDLDFILEYVCGRHGLVLFKTADAERARSLGGPEVRTVYAEGVPGESLPNGARSLADILAGRASGP